MIRLFLISAIATSVLVVKLASIPTEMEIPISENTPEEIVDATPIKGGDMIGTFRVSRGTIPGVHAGIDIAVPEGTPLYVFGQEGEEVTVECATERGIDGNYEGWGIYGKFYVPSIDKSFLVGHLSQCNAGTYRTGEAWGYSGNTGNSTGAHTHTEQFTGARAGIVAPLEEPIRSYIEKIHGF